MGAVRPEESVMLMCGMIGTDRDILDRARDELVGLYGPVDLASEDFPFTQTDYYEAEMGSGLWRRLLAFRDLIVPGAIGAIKLKTQDMEEAYACRDAGNTRRRINLDPGYIAPAKLVLATTKDFAHRVCLGEGIYAEVTLNFSKQGVRTFDWTYPDFKSELYRPFLMEARRRLLKRVRVR